MNREDIIRMAREAGLDVGDVKDEFSAEVTTEIFCRDHDYYEANPEIGYLVQTHDFLRFAALVAAHEREECAKVAEEATASWTQHVYNDACMHIAAVIRGRK